MLRNKSGRLFQKMKTREEMAAQTEADHKLILEVKRILKDRNMRTYELASELGYSKVYLGNAFSKTYDRMCKPLRQKLKDWVSENGTRKSIT